MSKKYSTRADFNWLPDCIEIPVALWKAPKAFLAVKDVCQYLQGIHFAPCGQVWATNGHIGITIDLPHAFADKPVPTALLSTRPNFPQAHTPPAHSLPTRKPQYLATGKFPPAATRYGGW